MLRIRQRHRGRRGAESVEFALVMPVLVGMVFSAADYGLFYMDQLRASFALQQAVRTGSMVRPSDDEVAAGFGCAGCVATVRSEAYQRLEAVGAEPRQVAPGLTKVDGICVLDLQVDFDHTALIGLVGVPDSYGLRVRLPAQAVKDC